MDTQLEVDLDLGGQSVHVGTAHLTRRGRAVTTALTYSPTYLARPGAYAVDPAVPLDAGYVAEGHGIPRLVDLARSRQRDRAAAAADWSMPAP